MPSRNRFHGAPWWAKTLLALLALGIVGGTAFTLRLVGSVGRAFTANVNGKNLSLIQQIQQLVVPPQRSLKGEADDRINVLLLGIGGEGHDGAYLADTIILASYKPSADKVALFSIPRDFVVPIPGAGVRKINYANALGQESKDPNAGPLLTEEVIQNVFHQTVQYYVRVDFTGFEKLINDLGGIEVNVDTSFSDHEYPTLNHGYQTISFTAGPQHMNGATALEYVRSRHGSNGEGSDFARSRRQQKVLVAVKKKVFSFGTLFNFSKIGQVVSTLGSHIQTDLQPWELLRMASIGKDLNADQVINRALDATSEGLLMNQTGIDGAYILVPRDSTYADLQTAFANVFEAAPAVAEHATIDIQNGTTTTGLAAAAAAKVRSSDLTIRNIVNAKDRTADQTVIYDLTSGQKPVTLARLKTLLNASVATTLPSFLQPNGSPYELSDLQTSIVNSSQLAQLQNDRKITGVDFVILIGKDQIPSHRLPQASPTPTS